MIRRMYDIIGLEEYVDVYCPIEDVNEPLAVVVDGRFEVVDCPTMGKPAAEKPKLFEAAKSGLLIAAVVAVIGFYFSFGQRLSVVETDIKWIKDDTKSMKDDIKSMKDALKLSQAAQRPGLPASVQEVRSVTSELRANGIKLDQSLVSTVGSAFLKAAKQDTKTWPAVVSLLDYKSFLNEETAPKFDPQEQPVDPTKYRMSLTFRGWAAYCSVLGVRQGLGG